MSHAPTGRVVAALVRGSRRLERAEGGQRGERFVKKTGKATAKLSPATMAQLADAFKAADFFALRDKYDNREMTDQPSAIVRFDDGKRKKSVEHYYGDGSAPKALSVLEERLDALIGTSRWIGRDK